MAVIMKYMPVSLKECHVGIFTGCYKEAEGHCCYLNK